MGSAWKRDLGKAWLDPELINSLFKESQLTRGRLKCLPCLLITTKHQGNFLVLFSFHHSKLGLIKNVFNGSFG